MLVAFAAWSAAAADPEPECRALAGAGAEGVPLYPSPTAGRPVAHVSVHAELSVFPSGEARWQVALGDRTRWVDAARLAPAGSCSPGGGTAPAEEPPDHRDAAFDRAVRRFRRAHPVPGSRPWLVYVSPADEAEVRGLLLGRRFSERWAPLVADVPPPALDPAVVGEVVTRRASCAVAVHRGDGGWHVEPLAGWCHQPPGGPDRSSTAGFDHGSG